VTIGKEAYGIYIFDKGLVKEVKLGKELSSSCNNFSTVCDKSFKFPYNYALR